MAGIEREEHDCAFLFFYVIIMMTERTLTKDNITMEQGSLEHTNHLSNGVKYLTCILHGHKKGYDRAQQ